MSESLQLLGEVRALVWCLRLARYPERRRSLAMQVRHRLRRLEGTEHHAIAVETIGDLSAAPPCGFCGQAVRRRTRLARKAPSQP